MAPETWWVGPLLGLAAFTSAFYSWHQLLWFLAVPALLSYGFLHAACWAPFLFAFDSQLLCLLTLEEEAKGDLESWKGGGTGL